MTNPTEGVKGVQSIVRAAKILRLIGSSHNLGCTATEVSRISGLHLATAKRILAALTQEGLLIRNEKTKRYFISYDLYLLSSKSYLPLLKDELHQNLVRLADESEDTVFLLAPVGSDALCIDRVEGNFPIKTLTFNIGDCRPLGIGAGGLALLSSYPPDQVERIIRTNKAKYLLHNKRTPKDVRAFVDETRKKGYALSIGNVTPGAASVALPLLNPLGEPMAALAIAAVKARMKPSRRQYLVDLLRKEIEEIEPSLSSR